MSEPSKSNRVWILWLAEFVLIGAPLFIGGCMTSVSDWVRNGFKVGPNYETPAAPVAPTGPSVPRSK